MFGEMQETANPKKKVVHVCSSDPQKRANGAYLMGAYLVISQRKTADEAWRPFSSKQDFGHNDFGNKASSNAFKRGA